MKSTAYSIDTSRVIITGEQALGALRRRSIAGAALDEFLDESSGRSEAWSS